MTRRRAARLVGVAVPLALAGVSLMATPAFTQDGGGVGDVAVATYRERIARARRALDVGPNGIRDAAAPLRAVRTVRFPDGQRVTVDNRALFDALRAANRDATKRATARTLLGTLDASLAPRSGTAAPPSEDARKRAAAILAGDEFRRAALRERPQKPNAWQRFWRRVLRAIERFFDRLIPDRIGGGPEWGGSLGSWLLYVLYFLAGAAAVAALWTLARSVRERRSGRAGRGRGGRDALDLADDVPDALGAARAAAAAGDYRAALRLTYIASLRRLSENGLLVLERDRTNWEYQRALRSRSRDAHATLLPLTRDFDRIWYGGVAATRDEFERALRTFDALPAAAAAAPGGEDKNP